MSDVYAGNRTHYEALKAEISQFLHVDNVEMSPCGVDENSIQSLLKQGRKVDAIELVRVSQKIGLTEAVNLVNEIDEKMKAAK
jgi:ribosomal protein L7/L12